MYGRFADMLTQTNAITMHCHCRFTTRSVQYMVLIRHCYCVYTCLDECLDEYHLSSTSAVGELSIALISALRGSS